MEKHNGIISFWKFAFCLVIVIFHGSELFMEQQEVLFRYGSIAVEFFFIVAGYLMCKKACNTKNDSNTSIGKETFQFITSKFASLFPYLLIAFTLDFVLRCIVGDISFEKGLLAIFDLFMLRMAGFKTAGVMSDTWYISAMLITMALIYPQIKKFNKNYFYLIAPLSIILIGGWLNQNYGYLKEPRLWLGFTYKGVLRAYIEIMIGTLLYPLSIKLKKIKFTKLAQILLTIIECGGFMFVLLSSHFLGYTSLDYIMLLIFAISILIAFSEQTLELSLFNNKLFYFLEKLSLPIYLIHNSFRWFIFSLNQLIPYEHLLILLLIISIIFSIIMVYFVDYLKKKKYFIPQIKHLLIEES